MHFSLCKGYRRCDLKSRKAMKQASMAPEAVYVNVGLIMDDVCDGYNQSGAAAEQREADVEPLLFTAAGADSLEQQHLRAQRSAAICASQLTCAWTQLYPVQPASAPIRSSDYCPGKEGPPGRTKHASCVHRGRLYVHGGRSGSVPLKDFWRFDFGSGSWTSIDSSHQSGDPPGHLEGHTLVSSDGDDYRSGGDNNMGSLYVFGGELSFCSKNETSLWRYDIGTGVWTKCNPTNTGSTTHVPAGRRGHTTIVHRHKMHVFGGYMDFIGSTDELWTFDFVTSSWKLIHGNAGGVHVTEGRAPAGRHDHSAVHCSSSMLVYGGMTNLAPCYDLWQWSFNVHCWTKIHLSSLRRRAPKSLQLAVQVAHRVFFLSDGEENEPSNAEELRTTLWQLNMTTGVMKKCKQASAKLTLTMPAVCQYSLAEIRSSSTCHSAPPWQEPTGLNSPKKEPVNSMQLNEQFCRSFEAAGDINTAILHTLRNQVAPAPSFTDMPTPRMRGRGARHRMAFQNDLSIFSAFSTTRSTDCLLPPAASTRDALFGLHNPLRWSSVLSVSSSSSSCSGRTETVRELSNSSPSVKEAVTSDYEQLALARLPCAGSALSSRTTSGSPLHLASGRSTSQLPDSVWLSATSSKADDLRATVQQVAASAAASTETWSDERSGHQQRPTSGNSESHTHTTAKPPVALPSTSYNCLTELYMVGGLPMDCRGTSALASAYEGRTKQLTVWRCCILNEN